MAARLPLRLPWNQAEDRWATALEPILALPPNQGILLKDVKLSTGANTVNTYLGRQAQGWIVTDQTAAATVYRSQPFNSLTLTLTSSAPTTVSLWVF